MVASSRIKQRLLPLCAFLSAFTIVMTILVYSTDIQGRRYHRIELNLSIATDFQNAAQDNPQLIKYIRDHHLKSPPQSPRSGVDSSDFNESTALVLQPEFTKIFHLKRNGVFIETGAYRHGQESNTYWLEKNLGWRGLLTQPDPHDYNVLEQCVNKRTNCHIANVCISPTSNPKQVSFRHSTISDSQQSPKKKDILTNVECFPLYSLLLAYNTTNIDFLSLNAEKAEFQVLKTLPFHKVNLRVIGVVSAASEKEEEDEEDVARVTKFLLARGYKLHEESTTRRLQLFICSRANSDCTSPRITI